jgi:hypothetical protein
VNCGLACALRRGPQILVVLFLQRGPIGPCLEELSEPKGATTRKIALALLVRLTRELGREHAPLKQK